MYVSAGVWYRDLCSPRGGGEGIGQRNLDSHSVVSSSTSSTSRGSVSSSLPAGLIGPVPSVVSTSPRRVLDEASDGVTRC